MSRSGDALSRGLSRLLRTHSNVLNSYVKKAEIETPPSKEVSPESTSSPNTNSRSITSESSETHSTKVDSSSGASATTSISTNSGLDRHKQTVPLPAEHIEVSSQQGDLIDLVAESADPASPVTATAASTSIVNTSDSIVNVPTTMLGTSPSEHVKFEESEPIPERGLSPTFQDEDSDVSNRKTSLPDELAVSFVTTNEEVSDITVVTLRTSDIDPKFEDAQQPSEASSVESPNETNDGPPESQSHDAPRLTTIHALESMEATPGFPDALSTATEPGPAEVEAQFAISEALPAEQSFKQEGTPSQSSHELSRARRKRKQKHKGKSRKPALIPEANVSTPEKSQYISNSRQRETRSLPPSPTPASQVHRLSSGNLTDRPVGLRVSHNPADDTSPWLQSSESDDEVQSILPVGTGRKEKRGKRTKNTKHASSSAKHTPKSKKVLAGSESPKNAVRSESPKTPTLPPTEAVLNDLKKLERRRSSFTRNNSFILREKSAALSAGSPDDSESSGIEGVSTYTKSEDTAEEQMRQLDSSASSSASDIKGQTSKKKDKSKQKKKGKTASTSLSASESS